MLLRDERMRSELASEMVRMLEKRYKVQRCTRRVKSGTGKERSSDAHDA